MRGGPVPGCRGTSRGRRGEILPPVEPRERAGSETEDGRVEGGRAGPGHLGRLPGDRIGVDARRDPVEPRERGRLERGDEGGPLAEREVERYGESSLVVRAPPEGRAIPGREQRKPGGDDEEGSGRGGAGRRAGRPRPRQAHGPPAAPR